jgi:hypothetical protein
MTFAIVMICGHWNMPHWFQLGTQVASDEEGSRQRPVPRALLAGTIVGAAG